MVNPDSDLYRAHPDWALVDPGYEPVLGRHQLVLDLAIPAAFDEILGRLDALLGDHDIAFVKWDMNRDHVQATGADGRAGTHAQTLALYRLLDELRRRHPDVEFESCSSGGARIDLGILQRTERVWTSDCNDALERQTIQRYASMLIPPEVIGAHVGPPTAHTTGRTQTLGVPGGDGAVRPLRHRVEPARRSTTTSSPSWPPGWSCTSATATCCTAATSCASTTTTRTPSSTACSPPTAAARLIAYVQLTTAQALLPRPVRIPELDPERRYRVALVELPGGPAGRRLTRDADAGRVRARAHRAPARRPRRPPAGRQPGVGRAAVDRGARDRRSTSGHARFRAVGRSHADADRPRDGDDGRACSPGTRSPTRTGGSSCSTATSTTPRWRRSPPNRPTPGYDPSLLHRRYDRLTDAWVLVSPARNVRPSTTTTGEGAPPCPLCPGGPELPGPFGLAVFENRYPSMSPHAPDPVGVDTDLVRSSLGRCLVVVYTDRARRAPRRPVAAAVRRRRRRVARADDGAVGRGPRLRDGVREPRQRRRRHAAPPPRPALRLRPPAAGDGDEAGQPRPPPPRPRRLPRLPARRRGPRQRAGDPRQRALRRRHPVRLPLAAGGPRPGPPPRHRPARRPRRRRRPRPRPRPVRRRAPLRPPVGIPAAVHDVRAGGAAGALRRRAATTGTSTSSCSRRTATRTASRSGPASRRRSARSSTTRSRSRSPPSCAPSTSTTSTGPVSPSRRSGK